MNNSRSCSLVRDLAKLDRLVEPKRAMTSLELVAKQDNCRPQIRSEVNLKGTDFV